MNGFIFCELCDFKTPKQRKDNFQRHLNQVHLKILSKCDKCGKEMRTTSLSRHRKTACFSSKLNQNNVQLNKHTMKECDWCKKSMTAAAIYRHKKISCPLRMISCPFNNISAIEPKKTEEIHIVKSGETSVKYDIYSDGTIAIGDISIDSAAIPNDTLSSGENSSDNVDGLFFFHNY